MPFSTDLDSIQVGLDVLNTRNSVKIIFKSLILTKEVSYSQPVCHMVAGPATGYRFPMGSTFKMCADVCALRAINTHVGYQPGNST